jgi:hypothetical protein
MGCVDCGGDNNWDNCDALEIEKGTNRLPIDKFPFLKWKLKNAEVFALR